MNLETRIREAVDEALATPLDLDGGLLRLQRTRRHRAAARTGALATLAALVAIGFSLTRHQDAVPQPAPSPRHLLGGAIVSLTQEGQVVQVAGPHLPYLPVSAAPLGPFEFRDGGSALLYADDGDLRELDLATGVTRVVAPCAQSACVDRLDPDGRIRATVRGDAITFATAESSSVRESSIDVGMSPVALSWSPDGRQVVFSAVHEQSPMSVELLDRETRRVTRLAEFLHSDTVMGDLMWSPDGHQIAFLLRTASGEVRLMTVTPTSDPLLETVKVLGTCTCYHALPSLAWSPDGTRIAVSLPSDTEEGGPIWSVRRDGTGWHKEAAGAFDNRLAWQPYAVTQP